MPNELNVIRPLTLIGPGRSGSSLVSNIIGAHPDVDFVGETGIMLTNCWDGICRMEGLTRHSGAGSYEDLAAEAVRRAMRIVFPTSAKEWIQKPVNVSKIGGLAYRSETTGWEQTKQWYWRMMLKTFPAGLFFTILRDPRDIVASQIERWKTDPETTWEIVTSQYEMVDHDTSPIKYAVLYEELAADPTTYVPKMLKKLGLSQRKACIEAATNIYVPGKRKTLEAIRKHRDWSKIGEPNFLQKRNLDSCWARFQRRIDW